MYINNINKKIIIINKKYDMEENSWCIISL